MKKKKIIIILASVIILTTAISSSVYGYNYNSYQTNLKNAESLLSDEQYDDSIAAFLSLKSSKFSNDDSDFIDSKVNLATELKQSKETFDAAMKLFDEKEYTKSIDSFKNVKESDEERYAQAQVKIKEAGNLYITDNITKAKAEAENKNYANAIGFLDTLLTFDASNQEATNLKDTYNKEIQRIKDEEEAQKQQLQKQQASSSNSSSSNSTKNTSAPTKDLGYTVMFSGHGWFSVKLNSGVQTPEGFGFRDICLDPNGITYSFVSVGENTVEYEVTFHLPTGDVKASGVSSGNFSIAADVVNIPEDQPITIDISANYKGQTYTGSFSSVIRRSPFFQFN